LDSSGNGTAGVDLEATEASGNVIVSDAGEAKKLIALRGLDNFIVVDTADALLICPKADEQWIKQLVTQMKAGKQK
jgi:mannose-1-phosphate guanylyltransferase